MMRETFFKSLCLATSALCALGVAPASAGSPTTPIQHVIIIVGENHTFDNLFGTYRPKPGQTIDNLLSKGIVKADGTPGPRFERAEQRIGRDEIRYNAETFSTGEYATLPQPYTTSGIGLPPGVPDTRFPANLPNGPYQISKYVPYAAYTGDPVHRFFQMWQDFDGGKLDKFVWVEETIGTGSNGAPPPPGGFNPKEGAISMGFYNMNPFTDAAGTRAARRRAVLQVARRPIRDQRQLPSGDHGRHRRQFPGAGLRRRGVLHQHQSRRHGGGAVQQPDRESRPGLRNQQLLHPGRLQRRLLRELLRSDGAPASPR